MVHCPPIVIPGKSISDREIWRFAVSLITFSRERSPPYCFITPQASLARVLRPPG
jgi:hypothetical protein